jgi:hypothetical protein
MRASIEKKEGRPSEVASLGTSLSREEKREKIHSFEDFSIDKALKDSSFRFYPFHV